MNLGFLQKFLVKKKKFKINIPGLETRRNKKKFWRNTLVITGYVLLGLVFATAIAFAWFSKDLPTPSKIAGRKPTQSTKIYDRTSTIMLYETGDQKRTIVESDQISQYLKDATVAVEDQNFYTHHGVEPSAIFASIYDRITGKSSSIRGGSTITQQYVKNALLTSNRSLIRKAKEAILSVELEFMFDKDQILTMYLNEIPYGNATAGAEAASRMYFGKAAKDLTLAEAATLAAIPQAPTYYSPYGTHVQNLIYRRNFVIEQMIKTGKITQDQADEAKKQDTTTLGIDLKPRRDSMLAPHFAMYVLEQIADEYGEDKIQKEGLKIITTLDYDKQKAAEEAVAIGVPKITRYGAGNASVVAVDPKTGQVLAMVGSKDYFDTSIDGNVNIADSLRQPGSSFKPFAYATAFKKPDYSPSKIIYDFQTDFGGNPPYIPHNYNGKNNGPITMRQALSNSLNVPAVKVMSLAGIDNVLQTASDMGITTLTQRDRYGLSLVLGAGEVKPVEMAGAFSVFATGGTKNDLAPILKIMDSSGKTLYDYDKEKKNGKQVLDPQIAYEISSILSDNNARSLVFGTRTPLYFPDRTVAVKTGTTTSFKDAWTVGYTPSIAVAVWVGNADATAMKSGADGSVVAAPIFHAFVDKALSGTPNEEFTKPAGIVQVTVEKYSNKLPGPYSTETTTDLFADWQVPKDTDDIHKVVRVCKGTDLIAPDGAPAGLVQDKVYADLHSERPDNPNWENPVIVWAQANGLSTAPPSQQCDINALNITVGFTNPSNNSTVSGNTVISVNATGAQGLDNVEFFLDNTSIGKSSAFPYQIQYNFSPVSAGAHQLKAIASSPTGVTASAEITINVSAGASISTPKVTVSSNGSIHADISWTTNVPTTTSISYTDGTTTKTATSSSLLTNHTMTLSNLSAGKNYSFTLSAKNADDITTSTTGTFVTPLSSETITPVL